MVKWKPIKDYEGLYEVSNTGCVRSLTRLKFNKLTNNYNTIAGRELKPNKVAFDYLQVTLYKEGKRKCRYIHNLVMESFVGDKPKGYEVNHIDEDKSNNNLSNLEYLTCKDNNNYGTRKHRASKSLTNGKKSKSVIGISIYDGSTVEFPSISEAKRQGYGSHISDVILGKRSHCKGYLWKFKHCTKSDFSVLGVNCLEVP